MVSARTIAFVSILGAGGVAVAALSLQGEPARRVKLEAGRVGRGLVGPTELAAWIIEGRRDFVVVDLRQDEAFEKGHVRDAVHCGSCHENKANAKKAMQEHFVDLSKKLVVYTETGRETIELPTLLARNPRLYVLDGGYEAWKKQVLGPADLASVGYDEAAADEARRHEVIRAFFAGERPSTAAPARLPITPIRREGAHAPAAAHEGC